MASSGGTRVKGRYYPASALATFDTVKLRDARDAMLDAPYRTPALDAHAERIKAGAERMIMSAVPNHSKRHPWDGHLVVDSDWKRDLYRDLGLDKLNSVARIVGVARGLLNEVADYERLPQRGALR